MLTFLKEKEREHETPFTNTSCNAFCNRGHYQRSSTPWLNTMTYTWLSNTPKSNSCLAVSFSNIGIFTSLDYRFGCRGEHQSEFGYSPHILFSVSAPLTLLHLGLYYLEPQSMRGIPRSIRCNLSLNQTAYPSKQLCSHILVGLTAKAESRLAL